MTTRRGRSRAMGEGELEEGLGRDAYRVLLQWSQQQRLHHKLDRWFGNGKTSAKVAVVDRHDELRRQSRKLVLKLDEVRDEDFTKTEYARHCAAAWASGRFAARHLAELVDGPIPVGDGNDHCDADVFAKVCRRLVQGLLAGWAGPPHVAYYSVPAFLRLHLGDRLDHGKPLDVLARSMTDDLVMLPDPLPNPFRLLEDGPATRGIEVAAPVGRSHGDLHVENALVRVRPKIEPADFRLIDLAKYEENGPLARDPVHFLLHMAARSLPYLGPAQRDALLVTLLDPASTRRDQLPTWLAKTITEVYRAGEEWVGPSGFGPEWRRHRPLSLLACSLIVHVRRTTRREDRDWFMHLAARSAAASPGAPISTAASAVEVPAPRDQHPARPSLRPRQSGH